MISDTTDEIADILWPYQLRVDAVCDVSSQQLITAFLKSYDIERWLISHERGKKTGKVHYQGIIFSKKELKDNCRNKIRYYFKSKLPDLAYHKNQKKIQKVSITKARNIKSLESYCIKTNNIVMTNYTQEEISAIPEWTDSSEHLAEIANYIKSNQANSTVEFCSKLVKIYIKHDKNPPTKQVLMKYLLKSRRMTIRKYLETIGIYAEYDEDVEELDDM